MLLLLVLVLLLLLLLLSEFDLAGEATRQVGVGRNENIIAESAVKPIAK